MRSTSADSFDSLTIGLNLAGNRYFMEDSKEPTVFGPNNHSRWQIAWRDVDGKTRSACSALLKNYGLDNLLQIHQVDEWERRSNNYRVEVAMGGGDTRLFLLRRHVQLNGEDDIRTADRIVIYLGSYGFPLSKILLTRSGDTLVRHDGNFWQMYEFIDGNHYRGTLQELKDIAGNIGKLHTLLMHDPFAEETKRKSVKRPPWTRDRWMQVLGRVGRRRTWVDVLLDDNRDTILSAINAVVSRRKAVLKSPKQIVHRDLHPWNTLYSDDGKMKALLDFSDVCFGELFGDIGFALHRFVRQYVVYNGRSDRDHLRDGIRAFVKSYGDVNPVLAGKGALAATGVSITDELLTKALSNVEDYYLKGTDRTVSDGELIKKLTLLKEASIVSELLTEL